MSEEIYQWHPRFKVVELDSGDRILISETETVFLSQVQFPFLALIDGITSIGEIRKSSEDYKYPAHYAGFLFQIDKLVQDRIFLAEDHADDEESQYIAAPSSSEFTKIENGQINLIINNRFLTRFTDQDFVIQQLQDSLIGVENSIFLVITQNITENTVLHHIPEGSSFIVIEYHYKESLVSPVYTPLESYEFVKLQQRIQRNRPILKFGKYYLKGVGDQEDICAPIKKEDTLSAEWIEGLRRALEEQIESKESNLLLLSDNGVNISHHPVNVSSTHPLNLKEQLSSPVVLQPCPSLNHKDGGCRTKPIDLAVTEMKQLVSPISGIVTDINRVTNNIIETSNVYHSSFHKTPTQHEQTKLQLNHFTQSCLGKGVENLQSQASALGEAIERSNAFFRGDEPTAVHTPQGLNNRYYSFQDLIPFSSRQYEQFNLADNPNSKLKQAVRYYRDEPIHWVDCWSLTQQETVSLPATFCFAGTPFPDEEYGKWSSNGCATGHTLEEAILQGLLELIERDAVSIWWYNKIEHPPADLKMIPREGYQRLARIIGSENDFWVLDITNDIGVPVMAAVALNKETQEVCFGFGCHLDEHVAISRALTELIQLLPIAGEKKSVFDFSAIEKGSYLQPNHERQKVNRRVKYKLDIKDNIEQLTTTLEQSKLETLILNYSRADVFLYTVKAIVPGLCHIWPQLASERLYQVPVNMDWLAAPNTELTLNSLGLYL